MHPGLAQIQRRQIELGGPLALLEWEGGDGSPLLCVHGADGSAANWIDLAPLLAPGRRVVALDLPGFGRSPLAGRSTSMTAYADLVGELIEGELGGRAVVAGNSMGGVVTVLAAARHPGSVTGVALFAPALPRAGHLPLDPTFAAMLAPFYVPGVMGLEARRRGRLDPERRVRSLLEMCYAPGRRESAEAFAEMVAVARERQPADQVKGWTGAFRSLLVWLARRRAFHAQADRIAAPTLIIEGLEDPIIPHSSVEATLARHPSWRGVGLDGVGHVPQLEEPARCAQAVEDFCASLGF